MTRKLFLVTVGLSFALLGTRAFADDDGALSSLARLEPPTGWAQSFGDRGRELAVEIPVVMQEGARFIALNYAKLRELGIRPPKNNAHDPKWEQALLGKLAFRPAKPGETPTHTVVATRYTREGDGQGVMGDGRAAHSADVVVKDNKTGKITGIYEIQTKGFSTGLKPQGWDNHGHGREPIQGVIGDCLMSHFLHVNGTRSEEWVAMIDTPWYLTHPDGARERSGLTVRGGNYLRVAHLFKAAQVGLLAEVVGFINKQLSMELGRDKPMSMSELYTVLSQHMAENLAQMFWLRVSHGSITADNTGLLRLIDMGTVTHMDRSHWEHAFFANGALGKFGWQADKWFHDYFSRHLKPLLSQAASSDAERADLDTITDPAELGKKLYKKEMAYRALLNGGLSEQDARSLIDKHEDVANRFLEAVVKVASYQNKGATHNMNGEEQVKDPARYDVYNAVGSLAKAFLDSKDSNARIDAVKAAMRTNAYAGGRQEDHTLAVELVQAFEGVLTKATHGLTTAQVEGTLMMMSNNALARNRHVAGLVRQSLENYAKSIGRRIEAGENIGKIRAELEAFMRDSNIIGPGTALHASALLAANRTERRGDFVVLAKVKERGVAIRQMSNGGRDVIHVKLNGNPLGQSQAGYRMHYTTASGDSGWLDASPVKHDDTSVSFEVDVTGWPREHLKGFRAAFWHETTGPKGAWYNNDGVNFGKSMENVFGSENVQAGLALHAQRLGRTRPNVNSRLMAIAEALGRSYDASTPRSTGTLQKMGIQRGRGVSMPPNPTARTVRTWTPQPRRAQPPQPHQHHP